MKIACLGGGPAGLYFAISMKLRDPGCAVTVYERNRPDDTFGWGVVFSDQTLENLLANDPVSAQSIADALAHWDDIDVFYRGAKVTSSGHGFSGIGRKRLLNLLQDRARALGVELKFETDVGPDLSQFADCDLVVAADGLNSKVRNAHPEVFGADVEVRSNKFVWLGTHKAFDAFTFIFEETEHGWIWAHAYRFEDGASTFIMECSEATWRGLGFDRMDQDETCRAGERIFARWLDGHALMSNARHLRGSAWLNFPRVLCRTWRDGKVVLMGDAAHTAHFSIGSGTKLALEDAIKLAEVLQGPGTLDQKLDAYQAEREVEVFKLQSAARNSTEWFEHLERYTALQPEQFAYALLTRSQRVSHENLRVRDRGYLEGVERWFAEQATGRPPARPTPPMFAPLKLREMEVKNRVVVSPMCMYSAVDGAPNDFHLVHLGARAMGGAGLVFTEMTDVSADGRITPGCTGMYAPEHVPAWKRIVDFVHANSDAKIVLQLSHAGRKGSVQVPWEGGADDLPLAEGNWELIAPSPIPWAPHNQVPREMTRADMDRVKADFVRATEMAEQAGFDMVELHCAHGYLLSSFLTPLSNRRTDEYGGPVENRLRFPLEVFEAMRAVWPADKPMSVRVSATDWVDEGLSNEDSVAIAKAFAEAGADLIDVSCGQTWPEAKPVYGRMFQTPFADRIRNEGGVRTMAVGNIFEADHVNSILAAGRADLCALARPHLADPAWSLRAAAELGFDGLKPPVQYAAGHAQLKRNLTRGAS
ncbi:bifunctional salicylyl-CoA 5-hydroxylase/oxidoreductase [Caulobacter sp. 17J80-11]|uniref:bifunctional salicylyl-CoA 5-hydroxylase/oxidoreductase n=1 Tax=Caulobacter sp. 17J80-11 TaxID=2763502 RepID=UPI00165362DA|nr:bifunctional salicylyl-CoA 5-hydroxylase/oxidoreductase [Caulobacter sp. 17J80-11]MBC6981150.1 bifunctional salicylyl-CoA 5-hydroxylase/oxidoreductase [Caulobacter sp. 17J80-11]